MGLNWTRRDFSQESPIRDTLLDTLLQKRAETQEIPEQFDDWIAAAGEPTVKPPDEKWNIPGKKWPPF